MSSKLLMSKWHSKTTFQKDKSLGLVATFGLWWWWKKRIHLNIKWDLIWNPDFLFCMQFPKSTLFTDIIELLAAFAPCLFASNIPHDPKDDQSPTSELILFRMSHYLWICMVYCSVVAHSQSQHMLSSSQSSWKMRVPVFEFHFQSSIIV